MSELANLRSVQRAVAAKVHQEDDSALANVRYIGAFSVTHSKGHMYCSAVVCDAATYEVLEKEILSMPEPMKYIPGYEAFREGVAFLQLFYGLEYTPDLIMIEGAGIAHPVRAGLACYIGTELEIPTFGVCKKASFGDVKGDMIMLDGEIVGRMVKTKKYANPLAVSVGHKISLATACDWVLKTIVHPHKKPEPLHIAARISKKLSKGGVRDE